MSAPFETRIASEGASDNKGSRAANERLILASELPDWVRFRGIRSGLGVSHHLCRNLGPTAQDQVREDLILSYRQVPQRSPDRTLPLFRSPCFALLHATASSEPSVAERCEREGLRGTYILKNIRPFLRATSL